MTQSAPVQKDVQTSVLPGSTLVVTQEVSSPLETATVPDDTVTTPGSALTVTVSAEQYTVTASGPAQTVTSSASAETLINSGQASTETVTQSFSTCAVTLAPSATGSPTYDPDSDLTWGCSPGTNCDPPKPSLCEVWTDSPVDDFICQAAHCQPVKALALGGGNSEEKFPLNEGYFVLDPSQFGLGFDIFIKAVDNTIDTRSFLERQLHNNTNNPDAQPRARDLDNQVIPAACFDTCNNAYLEAQSSGKGPGLCRPESAFMFYYLGCDACVDRNAEQTTGMRGFITGSSYLSGKFSQFLRYCRVSAGGDINVGPAPAGTSAAPTAESSAATTTTADDNMSDPTPRETSSSVAAASTEPATASVPSEPPSSTVEAETPTGQTPEPPTSLSTVAPATDHRTSEVEAEETSRQRTEPASSSAVSSARQVRTSSVKAETQTGNPIQPSLSGTSSSAATRKTPKADTTSSTSSFSSESPPATPSLASTSTTNDTIPPPPGSPSSWTSIAAPSADSPSSDDAAAAATSHDLPTSTEVDVSVISRPTGSVVVAAGSAMTRSSFLGSWGVFVITIVFFFSYVS